uniref:Uncharacterized protein n=1 Tax=Ditylenchus dipsaci TaxID=166011 RepID=A0A915EJ48_9BILA
MLNSKEPGLEFYQEPLKHNQLEEYSDGPPSLPSSSAFEINQQSSASTSRDHNFLGCKTRYSVILLNILLMTLALAGVVSWSWNNHWMAAVLGVAVLCIHAILWLNIFLFQRSLLYKLFLVVYAVLFVLEVIYRTVKLSCGHDASCCWADNSHFGVFTRSWRLQVTSLGTRNTSKEENINSGQDIAPEAFTTKEILASTQTVDTGNLTLKDCWMIDQRQGQVFSKEFPKRRLSWA